MSDNDVKLAEIRFLDAHLRQRARICYAMVAAGIFCLGAGVAMLVAGLSGDQVVWFQSGELKVTAGGFGAVTMVASVAWGYVAYLSRPQLNFRGQNYEAALNALPDTPLRTPPKAHKG